MRPLILIVDDNTDILFNLKITLEFQNYDVITAEDGKEAVECLAKLENLPELIISDILMPEIDGYELFDIIKENPKWNNIPFLFLTAYSPINDKKTKNTINENDVIIKPYEEDKFLKKISEKIKDKI